jgi:hypothetical protein
MFAALLHLLSINNMLKQQQNQACKASVNGEHTASLTRTSLAGNTFSICSNSVM